MEFFWSEVERGAKDNPGIEIEEYYIDNMTQQLVKNPERFNDTVLLSTNLFMDIISECASGSIGSIGNVYSANIGDTYAMFEPAHGSAPKYQGMDKVKMFRLVIATTFFRLYFFAHAKEASTILWHPFRVVFLIAIAESSDI